MLKRVGPDASFPSGDAATAVAFALPLSTAMARGSFSSTVSYAVPALCVALACIGRVYFRAHYVGDVTVGAACTLAAETALSVLGVGIADTQWWHFAIAHSLFVAAALASKSKQQ